MLTVQKEYCKISFIYVCSTAFRVTKFDSLRTRRVLTPWWILWVKRKHNLCVCERWISWRPYQCTCFWWHRYCMLPNCLRPWRSMVNVPKIWRISGFTCMWYGVIHTRRLITDNQMGWDDSVKSRIWLYAVPVYTAFPEGYKKHILQQAYWIVCIQQTTSTIKLRTGNGSLEIEAWISDWARLPKQEKEMLKLGMS